MRVETAKKEEIKEVLRHRNGTDNWYRYFLTGNLYTDGVKDMAELCKAEWLVTDSLIICKKLSVKNDFIVVRFKYLPEPTEGVEALITYEDGNDNILYSQDIEITDFPLDEIYMFYENDVLCLPSER